MIVGILHAFFDDVRSELVLRELGEVVAQLLNDNGLVFLGAIDKDVLNDVVAILILHESKCVFKQLVENAHVLGIGVRVGAVLKDPLNDSAAVGVR